VEKNIKTNRLNFTHYILRKGQHNTDILCNEWLIFLFLQ
jgi:hypothetical protein